MPRFVKEIFIGEGSFGKVYSGIWLDNDDSSRKVALKYENKPSTENEHSQLRHEYKVYKELHQHGKVHYQHHSIIFTIIITTLTIITNITNHHCIIFTIIIITHLLSFLTIVLIRFLVLQNNITLVLHQMVIY